MMMMVERWYAMSSNSNSGMYQVAFTQIDFAGPSHEAWQSLGTRTCTVKCGVCYRLFLSSFIVHFSISLSFLLVHLSMVGDIKPHVHTPINCVSCARLVKIVGVKAIVQVSRIALRGQ